MTHQGVLCIFVKTPELSPVKTRLAEGVGRDNALCFYDLALAATAALALRAQAELKSLDVVWAVAEMNGLKSNRWNQFKTISQGEGDLGHRLHQVYSQLITKYDYVAFMGADSPHILDSQLIKALQLTQQLRQDQFVLGETKDGGFYFLGGGQKIPQSAWCSVEYSSPKTSQQLVLQLEKHSVVRKIETDFDIDTRDDLLCLKNPNGSLLPEQIRIFDWVQSLRLI